MINALILLLLASSAAHAAVETVGGVGYNADVNKTTFLYEVAKGSVPGHRLFHIPGLHEANVETTQLGDLSLIPNVVVIPDPGGQQLELISTSADDDGDPVGTGARTVEIHYLDTSGNEQSETVTMNGTTAVTTTATDIDKIQWIHVSAVGANTVAAGNISLREIDDSPIFEYIGVGGNQSLSARYTCPNAHTCYLIDWHLSGLKKRIEFYMRATVQRFGRSLIPGVFLFQNFEVAEASNSGVLPLDFIKCPAGSQMKISTKADTAGGEAGGGFTVLVVADGF